MLSDPSSAGDRHGISVLEVEGWAHSHEPRSLPRLCRQIVTGGARGCGGSGQPLRGEWQLMPGLRMVPGGCVDLGAAWAVPHSSTVPFSLEG